MPLMASRQPRIVTTDGCIGDQWGFDGFVISDLGSIEEIAERTGGSQRETAASMALRAGVDADLGERHMGA